MFYDLKNTVTGEARSYFAVSPDHARENAIEEGFAQSAGELMLTHIRKADVGDEKKERYTIRNTQTDERRSYDAYSEKEAKQMANADGLSGFFVDLVTVSVESISPPAAPQNAAVCVEFTLAGASIEDATVTFGAMLEAVRKQCKVKFLNIRIEAE
jgi:hypothetical protein